MVKPFEERTGIEIHATRDIDAVLATAGVRADLVKLATQPGPCRGVAHVAPAAASRILRRTTGTTIIFLDARPASSR
jgi:hypothetical protein